MSYPIADFIIRLKNASLARRKTVLVPATKINKAISDILTKGKYIESVKKQQEDSRAMLLITLLYIHKSPVISSVSIVSKPQLRVYAGAKGFTRAQKRGIGMSIVSTSKGIMTDSQAKKLGVGGEILFTIH